MRSESSASSRELEGSEPQRQRRPVLTSAQPGPYWVLRPAGSALSGRRWPRPVAARSAAAAAGVAAARAEAGLCGLCGRAAAGACGGRRRRQLGGSARGGRVRAAGVLLYLNSQLFVYRHSLGHLLAKRMEGCSWEHPLLLCNGFSVKPHWCCPD